MSPKFSFYIPRIYGDYTVEDVMASFRLLFIGEVRRVDIKDKCTDYMSVFVHMDYLYDTEIAWNIVNDTHTKAGQYTLWVDPDFYWIILKNTNPVADTHLNCHQLAENTRLLEEKVVKLEEVVQRQSKQQERLQFVLSTLINKCLSDPVDKYMLNYMYYGTKGLYDLEKHEDNSFGSKSTSSGSTSSGSKSTSSGSTSSGSKSTSSGSTTTYSDMPALINTCYSDSEDEDAFLKIYGDNTDF
jgi:hypothetical protein